MAELDFDAKYKPNKRQNEVDELGEHMNMLSATLETTISELKSANNELKKDIEKKEEIDRMLQRILPMYPMNKDAISTDTGMSGRTSGVY